MDEKLEYTINCKIGKARIETRDGIFCECGNELSNILEKCSKCDE